MRLTELLKATKQENKLTNCVLHEFKAPFKAENTRDTSKLLLTRTEINFDPKRVHHVFKRILNIQQLCNLRVYNPAVALDCEDTIR